MYVIKDVEKERDRERKARYAVLTTVLLVLNTL
jgi:hypothetical protein